MAYRSSIRLSIHRGLKICSSRKELGRNKQNFAHVLIIALSLLIALTACSSGNTTIQASTTPTQQPSPTATSLPAGLVLYQSNFAHGLTGLQKIHGWKVIQGQLESDASGTGSFTIPYQPATFNFAVEVRVQIVGLIQKNGGFFMITTPQAGQKDGYQCGVADLKGEKNRPNGDHPQANTFLLPGSDVSPGTGSPIDYEPGPGWRVYRVEIRDGAVGLRIDGVEVGTASSAESRAISLGPISFNSDQVILRISDVRIVTL